MLSKFASVIFFITFGLLIILVSLLSQKPQCFNSKLIETIIFSDQSQIKNCLNQSKTPFSRKFELEKLKWEKEIFAYENWLYHFWPTSGQMIKIKFNSEPQIPRKNGNEILLWDDYALNSWAIKKLITESVLINEVKDAQTRSFVSDLFVRIWTQNHLVGYGDITSYFTYHWWLGFESLSIKHQLLFLNEVSRIAKSAPQNNNHYDLLNWLKSLVENERSLSHFKKVLVIGQADKFYDLSAKFDFLLMVNTMSTNTLEQMDLLQKRFPDYKMGVWDGQVLYHVPSQSYLSAKAFRQIEADHYVWEVCEDIEFKLLSNLPAQARKILLVKNCGTQNLNAYASYFGGHTEKFAASHPKAEFILFDVPSLMTQRDLFMSEIKVFSFLSRRAEFSEFIAKLGWLGVDFDEKLGIHIPKSPIETIQYFRVKSESL